MQRCTIRSAQDRRYYLTNIIMEGDIRFFEGLDQ
jgi:hypothetical protein